jgi:hypothetical protein
MPRIQTDGLVLEEDIWKGPSNTNYVDIVMTDDTLRPQTTSRMNKYYTAKPYEFPRLYEVENDIRVMQTNPVSTYALYQSQAFAQRYTVKQ